MLTATCRVNAESIRKFFQQVRQGDLSPDDAVERLRHLPFEDLGFAKVDHHRALRNGMPEIILGEGKTPAQVAGIFSRLAKHGGNVLATRANEKQFAAVKKKVRGIEYRELARAIVLQKDPDEIWQGHDRSRFGGNQRHSCRRRGRGHRRTHGQ